MRSATSSSVSGKWQAADAAAVVLGLEQAGSSGAISSPSFQVWNQRPGGGLVGGVAAEQLALLGRGERIGDQRRHQRAGRRDADGA